MKKYNYLSLIIILLFFFTAPHSLFANSMGNEKDGKKGRTTLPKTTADPFQSLLNINGASMWVTDYGFHDWVVGGGWNGAYPNGTHVGAIFAEGIVWGGQVFDGNTPQVRVCGNTYQSGTAKITRLFRVRPDYLTANLASDAATYNDIDLGQVSAGQIQEIKDQYAKDWAEWPANEGALYEDVDQDGTYNPDIDIPGIPGAAQTIFIKYDDRNSESQYGSPPIGLEVKTHYWAYAYSGALGNVIFQKVDFIYKGTQTSAANSRIDSMYIVAWADPDVGTSSDDFAGCDTTLNMGYAFSSGATDGTFAGLGLAPPAGGYDFLQGVSKFTGNPLDSAIFDLKWRKGYKYVNRQPMSSYVYFAAGGAWEDPDFSYNGTLEFYNLMRGVKPIPRYPSASPFPDAVVDYSADGGVYLLAGDPVAGTGKIDGSVEGPGDRRIMVTNGPISMNLGDTAQVVVALVYGLGTDNLSSVTAMKTNDLTAQIVFDQLFQLPNIAPPVVEIANLDKKISLNWGSDQVSINKIENFSQQGYSFEGYEVYQLPSASSSLEDGIPLATFDLVNGITYIYDTATDANGVEYPLLTANGTDAGIQRNLVITQDQFRHTELRNGQEYYFAVVSYGYNPAPLLPFHALRSPFVIIPTVPQTPAPGDRLTSSIGDTITTVRTSGAGDGSVVTLVVDPTRLTGHDYKVTFDNTTTPGTVYWNLVDVTLNTVVLANQTNQSGDNNYLIVDGIQVKVLGPLPDFKGFIEVANANGPHAPTQGTYLFNGSGFPTLPDITADRPTPDPAGVIWGFQTGSNGNFTYENFLARVMRNDNFDRLGSYDYEIRFTSAGGKAEDAYNTGNIIDVPFELWNIGVNTPDDPSDDYRMIPWNLDGLGDDTYNLDSTDHPISGGDNDPETDWIYWRNPINTAPGDAGYQGYFFGPDAAGGEVMARTVFVAMNAGSISDPTFPANIAEQHPAIGTVFRLITTKPNTPADEFAFTSKAPTSDQNLAKTDVEKINVFPNPYYGYQYRETAPDNHYLTFSHLPDNAVIRIFDLSGVLVKTIEHNPVNGQFERWYLQNDNNYPVASGIYVAYVDMPGLGTTKILKLAVIQEQQMLKVY